MPCYYFHRNLHNNVRLVAQVCMIYLLCLANEHAEILLHKSIYLDNITMSLANCNYCILECVGNAFQVLLSTVVHESMYT